jgi:hypothetical protein
VFVRDGPRSSELDVDVGNCALPPGKQIAYVHTEPVIFGGVDDRRGERTAERKLDQGIRTFARASLATRTARTLTNYQCRTIGRTTR